MPQTMAEVKQELRRQWIETPSWAYGNTGTRFKVFRNPAAARDPYEKVDDAAFVHRLTGVAPSVALHIPWDRVDDYARLAKHAADAGLRIGAINPNVFQEDDYRLGSVCNPDPRVRRRATDHLLECVEVAAEVGSPALSLWFADGTNYPGQDDTRARQDRLAAALQETYAALPEGVGMLLEYKLFEPGFYTMDVPDWGTSLAHCLALGPGPTCWWTPATTPPAPTSSSSWPPCCAWAAWAGSTSTAVSTPTTTCWWGRPTPTSCSGSCPRWWPWAPTAPVRGWRSCSTSATTSRTRSRPRSARS